MALCELSVPVDRSARPAARQSNIDIRDVADSSRKEHYAVGMIRVLRLTRIAMSERGMSESGEMSETR